MSKRVLDSNGNVIPGVSTLSCATGPVARITVDNTLGGEWFIQQVGAPATKASVSLLTVGMAARSAILNAWATGSSIRVEFDGMRRIGLISTEPNDRMIQPGTVYARKYNLTFEMAVISEEAQ